jgi:hypothetical protein
VSVLPDTQVNENQSNAFFVPPVSCEQRKNRIPNQITNFVENTSLTFSSDEVTLDIKKMQVVLTD